MAFGSGVLISAVAFELVEEAFDKAGGGGRRARPLSPAPLTFFAGDTAIDRMGGADRKHSGGKQAEGSALAIVLGIVLDGIPESIVLGLTIVVSGSVSAAFLVAVVLSNVPEAIAASSGLAQAAGRSAASSASGAGRGRVRPRGALRLRRLRHGLAGAIAFVLSFAGGAILTMLADTMMPEAFEHGGKLVGVVTTLGFALAFAISALE